MEPDERVLYTCLLEKYNHYGFCQDRTLMITNKNVYTMSKGTYNFKINRKATFSTIDAITMSKDAKNQELIIHSQSYDERFRINQENKQNIKRVLNLAQGILKLKFKVFEAPEKKLSAYVTSKKDAKAGKRKRPSDCYVVAQTLGSFSYFLVKEAKEEPQYFTECLTDFNTMIANNPEHFKPLEKEIEDLRAYY
jgi:hypothetical protein